MVNLYTLPNEIHALISCYLPDRYGNLTRILANGIIIKTTSNDCTYANGLLHSFNDEPIIATVNNLYIMRDYLTVAINDKIWFSHGMIHRSNGLPAAVLNNRTYYFVNNQLHRDNGPAKITSNHMIWCKHGKRHRDNDLPAYIDTGIGYSAWYQDGKKHRDNDLPAEISDTWHKYYKHGDLHRDNGPAVITNAYIIYYKHGNRHRADGPAVIYQHGTVEYYIDGVLCNGPIEKPPSYLSVAIIKIIDIITLRYFS